VTDYQLTYDVESGNSFSRTFSGDEPLDQFLRHSAVVPEGEVERAFDELGKHGRTTIPNVDIPLKETGPLGLTQEPSDY
jgi:hypothetical protein